MPDQADSPGVPPAGGDGIPEAQRRATDDAPRPSQRPSEVSGFHRAATPHREHAPLKPTGKRLAVLSLGALGVVYGDIGTSPLYTMQAAFTGKHGFEATPVAVYGVLSMIVWSLIFVVALKYIYFILRAAGLSFDPASPLTRSLTSGNGAVFLVSAGLMNYLMAMDCFDLAIGRRR